MINKKTINLSFNNLTKLTESDLKGLCDLNEFKYNEFKILNLVNNDLTNLNFIQKNTPFINIETLILSFNRDLKNINNIKYLKNLESLSISGLNLNNEKETVEILKNMKNLKHLLCLDTFKIYSKQQILKEIPNLNDIIGMK